MNVLLLGAGASKAYTQSKTKIKMPIAKDFFQTYNRLDISEKPDVLVGDLINYLKKYHKMTVSDFSNYSEDIENIHSEISDKVISYAKESKFYFSGNNSDEKVLAYRAYMQVLFLFNSVINEIQNGDVSKPHQNIAQNLKSDDVILTFNWDTLMDRALESVTNWNVDSGYYIPPKAIYNDGWVGCHGKSTNNAPLLIKLHGSTNWLTSYMRIENGNWKLTQELSPDVLYVYRNTLQPYETYRGRYWNGYEPFSYGYYPPNIPDKGEKAPEGYYTVNLRSNFDPRIQNNISGTAGLVSMPAIIPPVKQKEYNLFGDVFETLWKKAEESLAKADNIVILGYSFPRTDYRTDELFKKAFCKRTTKPKIVIINPAPDELKQKFIYDYGIDEKLIQVEKTYFDEKYNIATVLNIKS
jgi:hypothetical protein